MTLILHIIIALTSIIYAGYVFFAPSKNKLRISYALVAMTLISGTYLVISTNSPLLSACTTGLIYLSVVMSGLAAAHRRLPTID